MGPHEILKRFRKVAYELSTKCIAPIHPVFHVSMLTKSIHDLVSILPLKGLLVIENLSYENVAVEILDRQVK